ncbi:TetR/AcrR family transcriptional regulator [Luteimicrobium subarcticum]|uniref:TetR family transcriptional regulator n=1 Tax=Luteimicrobium subarcticum TaxID=620910 RepID=A0A2M8WUK9_9MICO|nr:TetR family transcriptional regulator [Luteimicrobium subarcticum]PJI94627.1 TetR family transcriptional regulator [Luteimicrobium subarcticum]
MSKTTVPVDPAPGDGTAAHEPAPRAARAARRRNPHRTARKVVRIPVAERRAALVEAAITVIGRDGVRAASTRAIVAEAGMSLASFHYVFESHDELMRQVVLEVLEHEVATVTDRVVALSAAGGDLTDLLGAALHTFVETVAANPERENALLELHQYALRTESLRDLTLVEYEAYYAGATQLLLAVAEAAQVEWTRPVEDLARYVVTLTDGLTVAVLTYGDQSVADSVRDVAVAALVAQARPR